MKEKIEETLAFLKQKGIPNTTLGIVLGTGLNELVASIKLHLSIPYAEIPHFPKNTQEYQQGQLIYGTFEGKEIVAFQGRFHLYEGYSFFELTYWVRVFAALGGKNLILSNAAGALHPSFQKGQIMMITDHINLQGGSPLAEKGIETLGERFVDMSSPYNPLLRKKAEIIAKKEKVILHHGVYAAVVGPQLETAAEYKYLKIIGADAVGMSTVPEVIVARQLKINCIAFSVLTDECNPNFLEPISIPDILAMAKKGEVELIKIVKNLVPVM